MALYGTTLCGIVCLHDKNIVRKLTMSELASIAASCVGSKSYIIVSVVCKYPYLYVLEYAQEAAAYYG